MEWIEPRRRLQCAGLVEGDEAVVEDGTELFNLRSDPFETADHEGMDSKRWRLEHVFLLVPAQEYLGKFLSTFQEFPPSQKPGSFSLDKVMENLSKGAGDK